MDFPKKISSYYTLLKLKLAEKNTKIGLLIIVLVLVPLLIFIAAKNQKVGSLNNVTEVEYFSTAYVPDQLIVELKDEYTAADLELLDKKFKELGVLGQKQAYDSDKSYLANYYILKFAPGTNLREAKKQLDVSGLITDSHPNYIFVIQQIPSDPFFSSQWDLAKIGILSVWELTRGSNNIKVAVIDTGIDYNHPDFSGRTILSGPDYSKCPTGRDRNTDFCLAPPGRDPMDDHGHGTHVAGTIGAVTNNGTGISGMNPNVTLMAIKSMKGNGRGEMPDSINAMQYAIENGAKVINMSLTSGPGTAPPCDRVKELQRTIEEAVSRNIVVVVAAGNENQDTSNEIPTKCSGVIVVGATNQSDKRWVSSSTLGSNFGQRVDISAPGVGIISTKRGGYSADSGTSMAAPHVAGAAALLLSLKPQMTVAQVRNCLVENGDTIITDKPIGKRLNLIKAINSCAKTSPPPTATAVPNPPNNFQPATATPIPPTQAATQATGSAVSNKLTPTASKTYTCSQAKGPNPNGAIQIGNLVCTEIKK